MEPLLHDYINAQDFTHPESGSIQRPQLALTLQTDEMGITQSPHPIG